MKKNYLTRFRGVFFMGGIRECEEKKSIVLYVLDKYIAMTEKAQWTSI